VAVGCCVDVGVGVRGIAAVAVYCVVVVANVADSVVLL